MKKPLRADYLPSVLVFIVCAAFVFRLYGINWDGGHHLHPDERFLTMVTEAIRWPDSPSLYFHPDTSTLNPYVVGFPFFVYGMFPLVVVKFLSGYIIFDPLGYNNITLVGRVVSSTFDVGTLLIIFLIARRIFSPRIALFAAFFYGISVLPIQLSHFFTVDPPMVFFLVLSFFLLLLFLDGRRRNSFSILLGAAFGLSLASKISAMLFLPVVALGFVFSFFKKRGIFTLFLSTVFFLFFSYGALRLADPRIFTSSSFFDPSLNPQFLANLKELARLNVPSTSYPPAFQWIPIQPLWFPLKNMILWGFGLPLGSLVVLGVLNSVSSFGSQSFSSAFRLRRLFHFFGEHAGHLLLLVWVLLLFFYQGIQFVKAMRYFYPLYPFLVILAASWFDRIIVRRFSRLVVVGICFIFVIYPVSFLSIYSRSHSRVSASEWIYAHIPVGFVVSCEHWDDCLPLGISGKSNALYQTEVLPLFDHDTSEKWRKINRQLEEVDYLILSSNRLFGSIPKLPERFPLTSQFYADLFAGKLQFQRVATITSYPTIPFFNLPIPDDSSDESFTVYDHPQVMIFKKIR